MRKKSLLVGAVSPYLGPVVYIEKGEWVVEDPPLDSKITLHCDAEESYILERAFRFSGPAKIRAELIEGVNVSLAVIQVANA